MSVSNLSLRRALGGAVLVLVATGIARMVAMSAAAAALGLNLESPRAEERGDGILIAVGILAGVLFGGALLAWVARPALRSALALERPTLRAFLGWTLVSLLLLFSVHGLGYLFGRPLAEPEWIDAYRTAPLALLGLALTLTSIFEELYFRGLLQTALTRTRIGAPGAVLATAVLFTAAHFPGNAFRFADVFLTALLLGVARRQSGSSLTMIPGHVLGNLAVLGVLAFVA